MNELQTLAKHCLWEKERGKVAAFGKESIMKSQEAEREPLREHPMGWPLDPRDGARP